MLKKQNNYLKKLEATFEDVTKLNDVYTTDEEFDPIQTNTKNSSFYLIMMRQLLLISRKKKK